MSTNSFATRGRLDVGSRSYEVFRLGDLGRHLPYSLRILWAPLREEGCLCRSDKIRF